MVCYARPATRLAVMLMVALLVFGRPVSHFLDTAAFMAAAAVATGVAAVAAALVFAACLSTRRRRAAAGGCVACQFQCQHAMTEPSGRLRLVTRTDRRVPGPAHARPVPGRAATAPGRAVPVYLPMPAVRDARAAAPSVSGGPTTGPRWPDRPVHRARERAGASA